MEQGLELVPQPGRLGQEFLRGLALVKFGEVVEEADIGRGIGQTDVVVKVGQHPSPGGRPGAAPQARRLQGEEVQDGVEQAFGDHVGGGRDNRISAPGSGWQRGCWRYPCSLRPTGP